MRFPASARPAVSQPAGSRPALARRLAAAGVLAAVSALAPPLAAETLSDALAKAYATNPSIQAQRARIRQADEEVAQALSNWRPTVSISGVAGVNSTDSNLFVPRSQERSPRSGSLNVTQPLYRGGRTQADTQRGEFVVQTERARLFATEQQILVNGVTAYMNVLRDQAIYELNTNNEKVLARQLEAARDRFQVGEVTRTDVAQAAARLERAHADRLTADSNQTTSRANYERIIGEPPLNLQVPTAVPVLPRTRDDAVARAARDNPAVAVADFTEKAQLASVRLIAGELLPRANLTGALSRDLDSSTEGSYLNQARIQGELTIPLYQGGSVESRVRQAKQLASQRRIELEDSKRAAIEAAASNWDSLVATEGLLVAVAAQVKAASIALEGVEQEALVGTRTVLDVLDAEQELLNARVTQVRSQRDRVVFIFQLASAVGIATAEALQLPVDIYDFRSNYAKVRSQWFGTGADTVTPVPRN